MTSSVDTSFPSSAHSFVVFFFTLIGVKCEQDGKTTTKGDEKTVQKSKARTLTVNSLPPLGRWKNYRRAEIFVALE